MEALAGKTILLTGVTGFLAQVVFERLLADFPETRVVLLVRSQDGSHQPASASSTCSASPRSTRCASVSARSDWSSTLTNASR